MPETRNKRRQSEVQPLLRPLNKHSMHLLGIGLSVLCQKLQGVSDAPAEHNKVGPDYFGFYTCEVAELLSPNEDFLPFSSQPSDLAGRTCEVVRDKDITKHQCNGKESNSFTGSSSLFCNGIGAGLSDFKRERLKALLQQSVVGLTQEVDEMLDPVLAICRIQSYLRCKKGLLSHPGAACEGDARQHPHKKLKLSSSSSSINISLHSSPVSCRVSGEVSGHEHMDVALPGNEISNDIKKTCAHGHTTESSKWRNGPEGPKLSRSFHFSCFSSIN
ncbi:hypothetical protein F0562_004873 [Nyssa sinensis]|uniref:Uncharacterized protein n=1 Tax=Nyssa sinensis TaxID=561372 RepID=A0A5J5AIU1_9ASTE|nr:hypothetical protein F0562_004873 [Nyssa sinensis]